MQQNHRLAAILFTDIVGSTAVMQKDEQAALTLNKRYVAVLKQSVLASGGEILNDYGDGSLCTFQSATEALRCAINIQQQLQQEPKVPLRIGLHVGEIFFDDGKVFGDGVNVASRVESLGIANSILFSSEICNKIKNQQEFTCVSLGKFHFKNVDEPIEVFALANDGFTVPDKKKIEGKLSQKKKNKKLAFIAAGIAMIAALFILFYFKNYHGDLTKEKSIAILPFDITGNNEDELASGLVEDILIRLSKIKEFDKVISNKSSSQYRDTKKSLKEIGEELGAVFLVTGSIQESSGKIRVSAQLIDSRDGKTIWADDYTKQNVEIFDLQTTLAMQIVSALKTEITPEEKTGLSKKYTDNVEAYTYYLKGRNFWNARGPENFDSAEANFKQAIKLDPDYALAYAGLADCYTYNYKGLSQLEAIPISRGYANQALALDSNLSEGLTSLGFIQQNFDYDWLQSKKTLERAIELDPNNAVAHLYYGNLLLFTGQTQDGLKETQKALALDPVSYAVNWILGRNYYFAGENDKAIEQLNKTLIISPKNQEEVSCSLGLAYYANKMYPQAKNEFDKITDLKHYNNPIDYYMIMQSYGYALLGDYSKATELLEKSLKEKGHVWVSPYRIAQAYIALGKYNEALNQLDEAYQIRDIHMFWIKVDPGFNAIRDQQRFKDLLKKMGLQ